MSGEKLIQILDTRTEAYIQRVKDASSQFVAEKVKDALFLDTERHGVYQGQRVKIYLNNSQIIERAFKLATGYTIDQYIQNLPLGVRHVAGAFKSRLENMIASQLMGKLSELSVGKAVEKILLQGYGFAKQAIADRIDARYEAEGDHNVYLETVLAESNLQAILAKPVNLELPETAVTHAQEVKRLAEQSHQDAITLKDVLGRCEYQLKSYLNGLAQDATAYAVKKGLRSVSEAAMESTFDYTTGFVVTAGSAATLMGANPALGIASLATSELASQFKPSLVKSAGDKAEACAEEWIKQSDLYQREFIALDHAKSGRYECFEEVDEASELADDNEWSVVEHRAYSFTEWAKDKLHQLKDYFVWEANQKTSGIPDVTRNWFRDNDFDKLAKIRENYVNCEKKLFALELELMEATEYARGQRESITSEGLQMWRERSPLIAEEARQALADMRAAVGRISGIENLSRKQGIMMEGEKVMAKLSRNLTELTDALPKLMDQATPKIQAKRVAAR